jgi:exopolysaccharide biosynthesis polyprenyl glycosylphosphotransferase
MSTQADERHKIEQTIRHDAAGSVEHPVESRSESTSDSVRSNPRRLRRCLIASDVAAIVVGVVVATTAQQFLNPVPQDLLVDEALLGLAMVPIWILMMGANQLFLARAISRFGEELRRLMTAGLMAIGFLLAVLFGAQYGSLSRLWVGLLFVCVTGTLAVSRFVARRVFNKLRRQGRISRPVIIVGTGTDAISLLHAAQRRPDLGYEVLGFTGDDTGARGALEVLGSVEETPDVVRRTGATGVILSVGSLDPAMVNRLTRVLTDEGCHVTLSSSLHDIDISRTRSQAIDGRLMIYIEPTNRSRTHLMLKRAFDLTIASLVLLLALPIMLIAAVAIKLDSRGAVLFRQVRVGKDGVPFEILKLRTMCDGAEALQSELAELNERSGPLFKVTCDPRVTRVGRFLRKTSIDELPQLWNVIRGEMSIVGPRPALPAESEQWSPDLRERLRVMPGITGMWQVSGRAEADFEIYRRLDLYYVDNWSLTHDVRILLKTLVVVLAGRGAH